MKKKKEVAIKKRDILRELYKRRLTLNQVYRIDRHIIESPHAAKFYTLLGLSKPEATAHAHGVPYDILAKWRYEGWPAVCAKCGKKITIRRYGWWAKEVKRGQFALVHIACL